MKLKTTFFSMLICLLALSFSASAQWCGTAANGKYEWKIETTTDKFIFTIHPLTLTGGAYMDIYPSYGGGYGTVVSGVNRTATLDRKSMDAGTDFTFYFLYNGDGITSQEQSETFHYSVGTSCESTSNVAPTVSIGTLTGPFTSPATISIPVTATDEDGTVDKVEFYNGGAKIGESTTSPFTFSWANVQPGTYSITAKATDNELKASAISAPVSVTVGGEFTQDWCGQSAGAAVPPSGDEFEWRAETVGTDVIVTFHGIGDAAGSTFAIVNGMIMADDGAGNLTATIGGQTAGTSLQLNFTYGLTNGPGNNDNTPNPVNYIVGTQCAISTLPVSLVDFKSKAQADGTVTLSWATTSENNNNHFVIERSVDNKNFTALDNVASKGTNSQSRLNYSFTDKNPANGVNYYKLSQVDNNGTTTVLGIVAETVSLNSLSVIYPNPLQGNTLNISLVNQADGKVSVRISNLSGAVIYSGAANVTSGNATISLPSKPVSGLYTVRAGNRTFKLIVE